MDGGDGGDGGDFGGGFDSGFDGGFDAGFDGDFGGIEGMDGDGGLDSVPDGDLAADCLMLNYGHCGSDGRDCFSGVGHADVNYRPGRIEGLSKRQRALVKKLEKDPMRRFFGVHVVNHGYIDVMEEFRKIALAFGCHRIDNVMPNFSSAQSLEQELSDWNRWTPPYTRKVVPLAWYKGAVGTTLVQRQVWQLKKPNTFFNRDPEPNRLYDRFANTVIEVMVVTWYYKEAADYETRFQMVVKSLPEWSKGFATWTNRKGAFFKHQAAARTISEQVLERLKQAPPSEMAVLLRDEVRKRIESELPPEVPCSPCDPHEHESPGDPTDNHVPQPPQPDTDTPAPDDCGCGDGKTDTGSVDPRSCLGKAGSGADVLGLLFKPSRVTVTIEVPPLTR